MQNPPGGCRGGGRPAPGVPHPPERLGPGVGALGFFLCLALKTERQTAQGGTSAARRSACTNLWASLFVFLAALLRLDDLLGTRDASGEVI